MKGSCYSYSKKNNNKSLILLLVILCYWHVSISVQAARNPVIWADVPDVSTIRVGHTYYMSSTKMHMSPGLPILKSKDLVNWGGAGYAYDRLVENDKMNLENGQDAYGKGTWASSLRYHKGMYYISTFYDTLGKTHVYRTRNVEKGPWEAFNFEPVLHDNSLFFDDDHRVYMIYGHGKIKLIELLPDASGIKPGGVNKVIIENTNMLFGKDEVGGLPSEGCQMFKVNGKYYLFNIASPKSRWSRTVLIHQADNIAGPYKGRMGLQDRRIAQGGLIGTPDGKWFAMLFGDRGAVGRIPYLTPVQWKDGWPILSKIPDTLEFPDNSNKIPNIVASDEFEQNVGEPFLPIVWQWNHNPDNNNWTILQNPGRLRISTGRVDRDVLHTQNTLTQRTFGPKCSAAICMDVACLIILHNLYGYVGVKMKNGKKYIVMVRSHLGAKKREGKQGIVMENSLSKRYEKIESVPIGQDKAYFRIDCNFERDKVFFCYSLDGNSWSRIGDSLQMVYTFTKHFMGYRYGLFNYSTEEVGGYVDFDYYRISDNTIDF